MSIIMGDNTPIRRFNRAIRATRPDPACAVQVDMKKPAGYGGLGLGVGDLSHSVGGGSTALAA